MRYLKTFESYSVNENASVLPEESKAKIEQSVQDEVAKLSPEQIEEAKSQLEDFAAKHGLTYEDLKDTEKLASVLEPEVDVPANESWFGDKWKQFKNWIGGFLVKLGLVGFVSTVVGSATAVGIVGEQAMRNPEISGPIGIATGIAFAISTLVYTIGAHLPGEGKEIARGLGDVAGKSRR